MSGGHDAPSLPPRTYTAQSPLTGSSLTCSRCGRAHRYPRPEGQPVSCQCGWHYANVDGRIVEEFRPPFG